jgi:hypothetical protein
VFSRFEKSKSKPSVLRQQDEDEPARDSLPADRSKSLNPRREPLRLGGGPNRRFDFKRKSWFSLS